MQQSNRVKSILGLGPTTPSSSTPKRINLKNVVRLKVVISGLNATTVTGSAITLKQAVDSSGTSEKALSFTTYYANSDAGTSDTLTETTASSDTFTTTSTNSKSYVYVIDVNPASLDTNNSFNFFRVGTGNATATTLNVVYEVELKDKPGLSTTIYS